MDIVKELNAAKTLNFWFLIVFFFSLPLSLFAEGPENAVIKVMGEMVTGVSALLFIGGTIHVGALTIARVMKE